MVIHTYGSREDRVLLLLHPMGFTGKEVTDHFLPYFKNHYYIIAPDMGNHGDDHEDFKSIDLEMDRLYAYLRENDLMHIDLVLGLSMGAGGALILMQHKDLTFGEVYLDGAPVARMGFIMRKIFAPVLIWVKNSMKKDLKKANAEYVERYGDVLGNQMGQNFLKFTDESIRNIADLCVRGNIFEFDPETQSRMYFDWGSREDYYKNSTPLVRKIYPQAHVIIRDNYAHCEYMAKHPEEYISFIEEHLDATAAKKIKPVLNGVTETMLQSFYARAQYSMSQKHKFYDAKAIEIVEKLDYDFGRAAKDTTMSSGVIARTLVFDELVSDFIRRNPECTVVNIACGLDTRFYRMDNGKITWYNLDLPETIAVRDRLYQEAGRVSTIGKSVLDPDWPKEVTVRGKMLFIMEGLSMYLSAEEVASMLGLIRDNFDNATVMMECIAKMWVSKEGVEKSIQKTGAKFRWGADGFADLGKAGEGFHKIKDDNILRGMRIINPAEKLVDWLPVAKKITQKILVFEKD